MGYYKEYAVNKYGLIVDKKEAIKSLCEDSWSWFAIDESLKHDFEVRMFHQPAGYRIGYEFDEISGTDFAVYYCEEGFNKRFGLKEVSDGKILFYPVGFYLSESEEELYLNIQQRMASRKQYVANEYNTLILFNEKIFSCSSRYDIQQCPRISYALEAAFIFDRSSLVKLATPYLEGETEKIFVKM